jgi:hypothetical protein
VGSGLHAGLPCLQVCIDLGPALIPLTLRAPLKPQANACACDHTQDTNSESHHAHTPSRTRGIERYKHPEDTELRCISRLHPTPLSSLITIQHTATHNHACAWYAAAKLSREVMKRV